MCLQMSVKHSQLKTWFFHESPLEDKRKIEAARIHKKEIGKRTTAYARFQRKNANWKADKRMPMCPDHTWNAHPKTSENRTTINPQ